MRISLISCHFPPDSIGGGQVQSFRFCQVMGRHHDVTVYVRDYSGSLPASSRSHDFTVDRRTVSGVSLVRSVLDLLRGLSYIRKRRRDFDVFIAFHLQLAALMVVLGRTLFGIKAAISPRGKEDFAFDGWIRRAWQRMLYANCDAVLIQSETIKREFLAACEEAMNRRAFEAVHKKTKPFPNVIDDSEIGESRNLSSPFHVLFVGRLATIKGVEFLLEAMRALGQSYTLRVVGDGPERNRLEHLADGLPVEFLGEVSFLAMADVLRWAHIFVLPSLSENLPNAVLEALAAGLPVVASNVGALPEMVSNGRNGFLVPPKDSAEIANAVRSIVADPQQYAAMAKAARESAAPFSPVAIAPIWERSLEEIVVV